jgi:hypothetical protein
LEPTFHALFEIAILLGKITRIPSIHEHHLDVEDKISDIMCDLAKLVCRIAIYYRERISFLSPHSSSSADFNVEFGKDLNRIWQTKKSLCDRLWARELRNCNGSISIDELRARLSPIQTSMQGMISERATEKTQRAADTCEWMKDNITDFFRSSENVFTITGPVGCGKTVLAGWIRETLQLPLGGKYYQGLHHTFCKLAPPFAKQLNYANR